MKAGCPSIEECQGREAGKQGGREAGRQGGREAGRQGGRRGWVGVGNTLMEAGGGRLDRGFLEGKLEGA